MEAAMKTMRRRKCGDSAAVRIPSAVMRALHLELNEPVDVCGEAGRIVIEPARRKPYDVAGLLKRITSKNQPALVDFGPPSGKEIW